MTLFGRLSSLRSACLHQHFSHAVRVTIPHKWARLNKTLKPDCRSCLWQGTKEHVAAVWDLRNLFCFGIIFLAAIFGLRASHSHPAAFDRGEDSHSI